MKSTSAFLAILAAFCISAASASPLSSSVTTLEARDLDVCYFEGATCDLTKYAECISVVSAPVLGRCCSVSNETHCRHFLGPGCKLIGKFNVRFSLCVANQLTHPLLSSSACASEVPEK
jgi:hypothetical protein